MKSAYELAMERLNKVSPTVKLTADQKRQIAELESKHKAKIAECELRLQGQIEQATGAGELEKLAKLEQELAHERRKLQASLEEKKDAVRRSQA